MTRRSAREGSVFRSDDGRWIAMLELPRRADGTRVRKKRRARTKSEALQLLQAMREEFSSTGSIIDARRDLGEAVEDYRQVRSAIPLAESTRRSDEWMLNSIAVGLGRRRLADFSVADCDEFLADCAGGRPFGNGNERRPIGRSHLKRIRSTLIAVIRNEMRIGSVPTNVAQLSVLPEPRAKESTRKALSPDELRALLDVTRGATHVLVDLTGRNGLRPAEARGLEWSDIDFDAGRLTIKGQLDSDDLLTGPKTRHSARTLQLDKMTMDRLQAWAERQAQLKALSIQPWGETDLVITTRNGTPINRNNYRRSIEAACRRGGIDPPITPYELRHTAITHQSEQGWSSWELADWAGTSERMISEVYRHRYNRASGITPVS